MLDTESGRAHSGHISAQAPGLSSLGLLQALLWDSKQCLEKPLCLPGLSVPRATSASLGLLSYTRDGQTYQNQSLANLISGLRSNKDMLVARLEGSGCFCARELLQRLSPFRYHPWPEFP